MLCSRSAAVTRASTPRTAAIAPVAEEGGEEEDDWSGVRGRLEMGSGVGGGRKLVRARE